MKVQNPTVIVLKAMVRLGAAEGLIYTNVVCEDFDVDEVRKISGIKSAFNLDFGFIDPNAFVCEMVDNAAIRNLCFLMNGIKQVSLTKSLHTNRRNRLWWAAYHL